MANKLKIILLPGMDGTGRLFEPLCHLLSAPTTIIPLPQSGPQSYDFLANYVQAQLPKEDFIIVAESFSGPIAALLSTQQLTNLKGIVFVATFLSCPAPALIFLAKLIPLKSLLNAPFAKFLISRFLLGDFDYSLFIAAINGVPNLILKERLTSIRNLKIAAECSYIPSIYLRASLDCLVSSNHTSFFKDKFKNLQIEYVKGTHFLLQSNPKACSEIINKFFDLALTFSE